MCEYVPGEILISFPRSDPIGRDVIAWTREEGSNQGITGFENADEVLQDIETVPGTNALYRLLVPLGTEQWMVNRLYNIYQDAFRWYLRQHGGPPPPPSEAPVTPFCVAPNSLLHADAPPAGGRLTVTLTDTHQRYREMIGLDRPDLPDGSDVTVAVLDSGIVNGVAPNVIRRRDFVASRELNEPVPKQAVDDDGHGTAISAIISDIAPAARLIVYKVLDENLKTTEFDVLLALRSVPDAQIINLSLEFGFSNEDCRQCGRRSNPSRSMVFEGDLETVLANDTQPLVIAAAGNGNDPALAFPARYGDVVAIGSGTAARRRSSFSNYGARDFDEKEHKNLFFLPGGEIEGYEEYVAEPSWGDPFVGTSFATAYASAVTALLFRELPRDDLLKYLRDNATEYPEDLSPSERGNGLMCFALPGPRW